MSSKVEWESCSRCGLIVSKNKKRALLEVLSFILFFPMLLLLRCDEAVEVATDEVANHQAGVEHQYLGQVGKGEVRGYGEVVERIGQAVGESAVDEKGHTEQQRCILSFTSESNHGSHDESAADGQQACTYGTNSEATFKNLLCCTT